MRVGQTELQRWFLMARNPNREDRLKLPQGRKEKVETGQLARSDPTHIHSLYHARSGSDKSNGFDLSSAEISLAAPRHRELWLRSEQFSSGSRAAGPR